MRQPRLALAAAAALVGLGALGVAGPAGGVESAAAPSEIVASGVQFTPKALYVKPDTKVSWRVDDPGSVEAHQIQLEKPACEKCDSESDLMGHDTPPFQQTFKEVDVYPYYCKNHGKPGGEGMSGIVQVTEDGNPPPTTAPPSTAPPATAPPATAPPATAPPTTAPAPPPPAPAATTTTKPPTAKAAGKTAKPPKTATTKDPTTTTLPAETTTTAPPLVLPPLAERGPLVQAPVVESTTTSLPAAQSGEEGFVAVSKNKRRGGVKKATYAAVGALGLSLIGGGVAWWRRRPSRYWSA